MQRNIKIQNARARRAVEERAPKLIESVRKSLVLKGENSSQIATAAMKEMHIMKKPDSVLFSRKNKLLPFEDRQSLEFLCKTNDCSLFTLASHNKKRPHNLVLGRLYEFEVLDMFEFGVDPNTFKTCSHFNTGREASIRYQSKPCFIFKGDEWELEPFSRCKNLFLDYFRGEQYSQIHLAAIDRVIYCSILNGKIMFRQYAVRLEQSEDSNLPRVRLSEFGPSMDLTLRRNFSAAADLQKLAMKQPYAATEHKVKNKEKGPLRQTMGKIHMEKQDLDRMPFKKVKGLTKRKAIDTEETSQNKKNKTS